MSQRRLLGWWCLLGLLFGACSLDSSSEVASTGRQAVDVAPTRSLTSVVTRRPVEPIDDVVPAAPLIPPASLPDALAFKAEPSASASADAARSTTTVAPAAPSGGAPTTVPPATTDSVPESTTTTSEPVELTEEPPPTSLCPAPVFDNGSLNEAVVAVGRVDADAVDDVVVVGLDDGLVIRVVIDFGDGGQSEVGALASFGEFGSPLVVEFTGSVDRPLRVHRGSESVLVWVEDCVPLRAAND